jgi:UDP-N-acetylmuramoylalanine--D-glutamate ligase
MDFSGQRVTIMGLGRHGGGVEAARFLATRGAHVTVTDLADETALADSIAALSGVPIAAWRLGGHDEGDFHQADWVVVNPAVKPNHRLAELARQSGAKITSETEIFLTLCPSTVIGVTGSNGKSSTCGMIAGILERDGRRTWLGGNIGRSLLPALDQMTPDDFVVLELSSFQLWWLSDNTPMPRIAVITNCTANHLDWHRSVDHYRHSKQKLLIGQSLRDSAAVLNTRDPVVADWKRLVRGELFPVATDAEIPQLRVVGQHQRANAACAAAVACAVGCSPDAVAAGLANFRGLPHRIEFVGEVAGRQFFNDSKSTTPESTIAALGSFDCPVWLLAGGYDKGVDFLALVKSVVQRARGAAFYGVVGNKLRDLAQSYDPGFESIMIESLEAAFAWCWSRSQSGDTILLSPACASFDQFRDYEHRGETYVRLIRALASGNAY